MASLIKRFFFISNRFLGNQVTDLALKVRRKFDEYQMFGKDLTQVGKVYDKS